MTDDSIFTKIVPISDDFRQQYAGGQQPDIEQYLDRVDQEYKGWLLEDLIRIEHASGCFDFGDRKRFYLEQFPTFEHEIDVVYRELEVAAPVDVQETLASEKTNPFGSVGSIKPSIGKYKLLQRIGRGGMGSVWMAEQKEPVERRVAIKVIREEFKSHEVIARFEAERQALAMMDHPNIARVLDAGETADGSPYFVMELVRGIPFTDYCDKHRLSLRERLELFIPVCHAVHHAHQKSIVHRDIKPSNVMVTISDGIAFPKIIDFGLAKALETKLTDKTMVTEFGQVMGTLRYMSPEQADYDSLDVDTRSDIYSLGVMLYELLTGSTPIDESGGSQSREKVLSMIRDMDPPRPSNRLSSTHNSGEISSMRRTDTSRLGGILRGDLDWIVMKSIEKDRTRRYDSANAMADDIQRFLHNEPVNARPPSKIYQMRKLVRRHRVAFATSALIVASLLTTVGVGAVYSANLATTNSKLETLNEQLEQEKAVVADQNSQLTALHGDLKRTTEKTLLADQSLKATTEALQTTQRTLETKVMEARRLEADLGAASMRLEMAITQLATAEQAKKTADAARDAAVADKSVAESLAAKAKQAAALAQEAMTVAVAAKDTAVAEMQQATKARDIALQEAERQYEMAQTMEVLFRFGLLGEAQPDPKTPIIEVIERTREKIDAAGAQGTFSPEFEGGIRHTLGFVYLELQEMEKAKEQCLQAYELRQQVHSDVPATELAARAAQHDSQFNLARYYENSEQLDFAAINFRGVFDWRRDNLGAGAPEALRAGLALANVELKRDRMQAAADTYRQLVAEFTRSEDNKTAMTYILQAANNLAKLQAKNLTPESAKLAIVVLERVRQYERDHQIEPSIQSLAMLITFYEFAGQAGDARKLREEIRARATNPAP